MTPHQWRRDMFKLIPSDNESYFKCDRCGRMIFDSVELSYPVPIINMSPIDMDDCDTEIIKAIHE